MALTHDDVKKLIGIIDAAEHLEEMELTWGDFQIHLWRGAHSSAGASSAGTPMAEPAAKPVHWSPSSPPVAAHAGTRRDLVLEPGEIAIRAPMIGTFYRSASPGDPPFVEVGQTVGAGDTVCLIEVMKLFNSIHAGVEGTVSRILHENATLVEFDEPLIVIRSATDREK